MNVDLTQWAGYAVTLVGGGGLATVLKIWLDKRGQDNSAHRGERQDNRDDFALIVKEHKDERERLRAALEKAELKIEALALRVTMLEGKSTQTPFPEWMIDQSGHYIWCNYAFESQFLIPRGKSRSWLRGKTHADLWGDATANSLIRLDDMAVASPTRTVTTQMRLPDEAGEYLIVKWTAFDHLTGARVGFHGSAIPLSNQPS